MQWIQNSKIFKGSTRQAKILAAASDPRNKELVEQLESYVSVDEYQKLEAELEEAQEELEEAQEDSDFDVDEFAEGTELDEEFDSKSKSSAAPLDFEERGSDMDDFEEDSDSDIETDQPESEDVEESTKVSGAAVEAATSATLETIQQAVTAIPGVLNLIDETNGVLYAAFRDKQEIWIYYNKEVDLSKILESVVSILHNGGYNFLTFSRVNRDVHAIIFSIDWMSSYMKAAIPQEQLDG